MVELEQYKYEWSQYESRVKELADSFHIDNRQARIEEIEQMMEEAGFWDDIEKSSEIMKELKTLKGSLELIDHLQNQYEDLGVLIEMGNEEEDPDMVEEVEAEWKAFVKEFDKVKIETLLSGDYDKCNAVLKINAGAGGTESCDWANMLYRMFNRWAESKGYKTEVLDFLDGDEAGLKSITFQVSGENAYGYLKSEKGVHRLVRISPFNAAGKRQTSFASLDVMPDIEEDLDVEINDDDIRIDTYRSSGAGGQHINKTSSAIRITHFPTGIVVQCQNERSQLQNKDRAMKMLKSKLYILKKQEEEEKRSGIRGEVKEIGWGNQIRSYVMQPYTMVKDHRTNEEVTDVNKVLDGYLDPFINAYLKWINLNKDNEIS
ncbi:MAG: peptide chain release factor 2 [Eubacterium sp.]|nr:peptide chain release factor 2 [Eubacterium sp.]